MRRIIQRYVPQLLVVLAPLITTPWGWLDFMGIRADAANVYHFGPFDGSKAEVEFKVALSAAALLFVVFIAEEIWDVYLPKQRLEQFRVAYLEAAKPRRFKLPAGVRVNLMFARQAAYWLFVPRLDWVWSSGYRAEDRDAWVRFWAPRWMPQGVCGLAFRERRPLLVELPDPAPTRWWAKASFRMGPVQLRKTRRVRAILSIPIFIQQRNEEWHCVGVFNLDAVSPAAVEYLKTEQERLTRYFSNVGKLVALSK